MLTELNRAVACVSFEVNLVVAVVSESCSKVANIRSLVDCCLCNGGKSLAVAVVATATRHKVVDNVLKAFVSYYKVLPSLKVEFSSVHVNVKSARVVNLSVAKVEYPANLFKFLNPLLTVEDWANKFEGVVAVKTAVGN